MTISVTGCSTWMRVFISMKKNSPLSVTRNSIVPAPRYPIRAAPRTAASPMRSRWSSVIPGDGASSSSF